MNENGSDVDGGNEPFVPDLLDIKFECLFRFLSKDGKRFSHDFRCLFLVLALYLPGLTITSVTQTVDSFVSTGWGFFLCNVMIGVFVWLLVGFLRKMNGKMENVNRIVFPDLAGKERTCKTREVTHHSQRGCSERLSKYRGWIRKEANKWPRFFFSQAVGTAFLGLAISTYMIRSDAIGWAKNDFANQLYFVIWFAFLGFLTGASLHYIGTGFGIIRRYCKNVLSQDVVLPLDPDRTGGLKELGRISLDLDLIVALPSIAFLIYIPQRPDILIGQVGSIFLILTVFYSLLLVSIFFITLSPAHEYMTAAKTKYLTYIHLEYRDLHERLFRRLKRSGEKLKTEDYGTLKGLYELYDRAESMSIWPLDYRIMLRFVLTSILPIATAVISTQINVLWSTLTQTSQTVILPLAASILRG